jgi:hypothetical protein
MKGSIELHFIPKKFPIVGINYEIYNEELFIFDALFGH